MEPTTSTWYVFKKPMALPKAEMLSRFSKISLDYVIALVGQGVSYSVALSSPKSCECPGAVVH